MISSEVAVAYFVAYCRYLVINELAWISGEVVVTYFVAYYRYLVINEVVWISSEVVVVYFVAYSLYIFSNQIKSRRKKKQYFKKYILNPDSPEYEALSPLPSSKADFIKLLTSYYPNQCKPRFRWV
jgi:hypothetical protein